MTYHELREAIALYCGELLSECEKYSDGEMHERLVEYFDNKRTRLEEELSRQRELNRQALPGLSEEQQLQYEGYQSLQEALLDSLAHQLNSPTQTSVSKANDVFSKNTKSYRRLKTISRGDVQRVVAWHERWLSRDQQEGERLELSHHDLTFQITRDHARPFDLNGKDLTLALLADTLLPDIAGVILKQANLSYAIAEDRTLNNINLDEATCHGVYFKGAKLNNLSAIKADFLSADLSGANLYNANLSGANLSRANLSGAKFSSTNLSEADLSGANLSEADLSGANLSEADLSGANLSGAHLSSTNFSNADLSNAQLNNIQFRYQEPEFHQAIYNQGTQGLTEDMKRQMVCKDDEE